ncbi:phage major tail protein, TP901-1 family [Lactococcus lactis]|uniref:phage major tail protein, TP901-1 family n=1 Tax=Lactococcus lactis TaxID=1358 RepID=UPI00280B7B0E|nr:phage major tail protein, TP901-1 family [Lactococcus lactis]WMM20167.1 phage major tail protein, TP901-1 family [Lactococcus lactis]WMM21927.1 phage major tail protein, TP901-1 family [Lactococcus lactis]
MDKAILGLKQVLYVGLVEERGTVNGKRLGLQITHSLKEEQKSDTVATKDGNIVAPSPSTYTVEMEFLESKSELVRMLHYAEENNKEIDVWEVDLSEKNVNGKYDSKQASGFISGWEKTAGVDANVSVKTTFTANGKFERGEESIDAETAAKITKYVSLADGKEVEPIPEYVPKTKETDPTTK